MNTMPVPIPGVPTRPQAGDLQLRAVARRRWEVRREQEQLELRQRRTESTAKRASLLKSLRPGRVPASSLSPVYSMFREVLVRSR